MSERNVLLHVENRLFSGFVDTDKGLHRVCLRLDMFEREFINEKTLDRSEAIDKAVDQLDLMAECAKDAARQLKKLKETGGPR